MSETTEEFIRTQSQGTGAVLEMLQDLITAAINDAGRKVDEVMQSKLGGMLGGLGLGGMF